MKQKDVFLQSEGDAWLLRNDLRMAGPLDPESDPLLMELRALSTTALSRETSILEIGCGEGRRLAWLKENHECRCEGLDPSAQAVEAAQKRGVMAQRGTADQLPYADRAFDIVIFGFCLYLCDREDLFRIASEADRVLKNPGWVLIQDFYSPTPKKAAYHHRTGLFSYKMDYRTLFSWNPGYVNYSHRIRRHQGSAYSDDPNEWIAISVLRKNLQDGA
jgi:ubiquinone/menaquinone biosynthesis C-methylase UbiE